MGPAQLCAAKTRRHAHPAQLVGKSPEHVALLVHCQTSLVNAWRDRFGDAFTYDGTRALHVPLDAPLNQDALRHAIAMALTYRRPAPETAS